MGRTTEGFTEVDTNAVMVRATVDLRDQIDEAGADIHHDGLPTVRGDPTLLAALFVNLVGNSVKFRDASAPRVTVGAERDQDGWRFSVADNGIGIDPQYEERIFAIFQRLHLRDEYSGTGIGLALCRKIVEFHGGRIWLQHTEPGSGAICRFTLPEGRIPVVVLSTSVAADDVARSYDLHANVYVAKPVDFDDFAGVIKQIDDFFASVVQLSAG